LVQLSEDGTRFGDFAGGAERVGEPGRAERAGKPRARLAKGGDRLLEAIQLLANASCSSASLLRPVNHHDVRVLLYPFEDDQGTVG
jgi:hypothetical protein